MPRPKKVVRPDIKINKADESEFPYSEFPVKVIHKDGKDLQDKRTCYFQSKDYAEKYITRSNFKKSDYRMICRDEVIID